MAVTDILEGRAKDLGGGFEVRRTLPVRTHRAVGPFVFWDEMGPVTVTAHTGLDVRPHPHIGLATVTYLFSGEAMHRDTLGTVSRILPGDVNLMTAGRGIAHSERTPPDQVGEQVTMHGIQAWVALPVADEEMAPRFDHAAAADLPHLDLHGATATVILGTAFGATSPVPVRHPTLYVELELDGGASVPVPEAAARAVYVVSGDVTMDGRALTRGQMAVLDGGSTSIEATSDAHVMVLGGDVLDGGGTRHMWWNFVSSRKARIEQAKADWQASIDGGFDGTPFDMPPEEDEHIPLPG